MVSMAHIPVRLLVWNTMSALYRLYRGITAEQVSLCVVLEILYLACLIPIFHLSLISSIDTVEWRRFDWNVLACGTYCTVAFVSDTLLDGIKATLTLPIIILVMATMSYICYTEYLSLSLSLSSGDPPSVITAPMFLDISSSTVRELLGTRTFCGSHSCAAKQVTCRHVCSSLSVVFLVATPSKFPLEDNRSITSW